MQAQRAMACLSPSAIRSRAYSRITERVFVCGRRRNGVFVYPPTLSRRHPGHGKLRRVLEQARFCDRRESGEAR